jgi:uncharacterized NAD(P)/FAD-binding protein YdhS
VNKKIAVIGGGASATLFLAHLFKLTSDIDVTVYDESGRFHRGIAYSTREPKHLLNVRAKDMSAFHDDKPHFANWAAQNGYGPDDFVPRMTYGAYLKELAINLPIQRIQQTAPENPDADYIIVCTGNNRPIRPKGAEKILHGYYPDPFGINYAAFAGLDHVLILGTGLSAVDAIVSLHNSEFEGKVTAISRHGLLPRVHEEAPPGDFPFSGNYPKTASQTVKLVRDHLRAAEAAGISWQAAIGALRPHTNPIWQQLPPSAQKRLRRALPFWNVHRHRTAPNPGAVVREWRASGRLSVIRDSILSVEEGVTAVCKQGAYTAPAIINCLGYGFSLPPNLTPDNKRIFAIGPANGGTLLETTAIPEIRAQAHATANQLHRLISA